MQQGLLQPTATPMQGQQGMNPTPSMPQQEQAPQPQPAKAMQHPLEGQKRDYKSNPLNDGADRDQFDKMVIQATKLIHAPQTRDKVLARIGGKAHPYKDIASAVNGVMSRIDQQFASEGEETDPAVRMLALAETTKQVVDLAVAAGKLPKLPPDEDMKAIISQAVQNDHKDLLAGGKVTPEALMGEVQQTTAREMGEGAGAFNAQVDASKSANSPLSPKQQKGLGGQQTMTEVLRNGGGLNG